MRETGVVRFRFSGDEEQAQRYIGLARTQLGLLKQQMRAQELQQLTRTLTFSDGVKIVVASIFGQDVISIDAAGGQAAAAASQAAVALPVTSIANRLYLWDGTTSHTALQPCNFVVKADDLGGNFTLIGDLLPIGSTTTFSAIPSKGTILATATPQLTAQRYFGVLDHLMVYDPHFAYEWLLYLLQHASFSNALENPDTFLVSDAFVTPNGSTDRYVLIGAFQDYQITQPSDVALVPLQYFAGYLLLYSEFKAACAFSPPSPDAPPSNAPFITVTYPDTAVRFDSSGTVYTRPAVGSFSEPSPFGTGVATPTLSVVEQLMPPRHDVNVYKTFAETVTDSSSNDPGITNTDTDAACSYETHTLGTDGTVTKATLTIAAKTGSGSASASSASLGDGDISFSGVSADVGLFTGADVAVLGTAALAGGLAPQTASGGNLPAVVDLSVTSAAALEIVDSHGGGSCVNVMGGWIAYVPSHSVVLTAFSAAGITKAGNTAEGPILLDLVSWLDGAAPLDGGTVHTHAHFDFLGESPLNVHSGTIAGFFTAAGGNYGGTPAPGCVLWYRAGLTGVLVFVANDTTRMDDCTLYRNIFNGVDGYQPGQVNYEAPDQVLARVVAKTTIVANNFAPDTLLPWLDDAIQGAII